MPPASRRVIPLHDGPVPIPAGTHFGVLELTMRGPASVVITRPDGQSWFETHVPDAKPNETASVTLSLSDPDTMPAGDYTMAVTGNVQAQLTVA